MDFKILPFELTTADGDGSEFAGYANAFHNIDSAQEIVVPGAFKDTIEQFLDIGFIGGLNHNWDEPIGRAVSAHEDSKGLFIEGKISSTKHGQDVKTLLKDGVIRKMSIGYKVLEDAELKGADEVHDYWKESGYTPSAKDSAAAKRGVRLLTKLHLFEASPVTVPANTMADITRVKRYDTDDLQTERDWERFLRDAGSLSRKQATAFVSVGFKGLQRDADEATSPEPETVPTEPDTPPDESAPASIEAKTEPPTEVALVVAEAVTVMAPRSEVLALYATFLTKQARRYA